VIYIYIYIYIKTSNIQNILNIKQNIIGKWVGLRTYQHPCRKQICSCNWQLNTAHRSAVIHCILEDDLVPPCINYGYFN